MTTIQVKDEVHLAALKKQIEYKEKGKDVPSITELVNKAASIGMNSIEPE